MTTFDFTSNRSLSKQEIMRLEKIGSQLIEPYNDMISEVGKVNQGSLSWWSIALSSRYSLGSSLFDDLSLFFLFRDFADEYDRVIVDDCHLYRELISFRKESNLDFTIVYHRKLFQRTVSYLRLALRFLRSCYLLVFRYIYCKKVKRNTLFPKRITLIRNYILNNNSNVIEDSCFPSFREYLLEGKKNSVYYFPLICASYKGYKQLINRIKKNYTHYILPNHYISFGDCLRVACVVIKSLFLKLDNASIRGINLGRFLGQEHLKHFGSLQSLESLCFFFAVKNMSDKGIDIDSFICWYEGQSIDKLLSLSVSLFYGESKFIGYQGFLQSKYNLANVPTPFEIKSGVTPKVLTSCVYHIVAKMNLLGLNLTFDVAPAFRLLSNRQELIVSKALSPFRLLIALGLNGDENKRILDIVTDSCQQIIDNDVSLVIRPHPADQKIMLLLRVLESSYPQISVSKKLLSKELSCSHMIFGAASSVLLEALIQELGVCIYVSDKALTRNIFDELMLSQRCINQIYCADDLIHVITSFMSEGMKSQLCHPDPLVVPVNTQTKKQFLSLCVN